MESLSKLSMDVGAAGVMIAPTPGLNTEQKILNYYKKNKIKISNKNYLEYKDY